jgi:glycosyltransferase involved in cell wall biosynthesis
MTTSLDIRQLRTCCFANPFANHSYFTVRALASSADLAIFCPPLQLQLLLGQWNAKALRFVDLPLQSRLASILCVIAYLSFRSGLINHSFYLRIFRFLLIQYLDSLKTCRAFVFYQDYVADLVQALYPGSLRICELIIASDPSQDNHESTLAAIRSSSIVVLPTPSLADIDRRFHAQYVIAPYGGNKSQFYAAQRSTSDTKSFTSGNGHEFLTDSSASIRIIARAHSFRKGADILFGALLLLDSLLSSSGSQVIIDVLICGSISEPVLISDFHSTAGRLNSTGRVRIKCMQLTQSSFSRQLASSDLFVMPSRLESTSLAALEALWHGLPSILTLECGVDVFEDARHGILLRDHKSLSLASAIHGFCVEPHKLHDCREFLAQDRALFTWNRYFQAYRELLA